MTDIRGLKPDDRAQWQQLWAAYLRFYRQHLPEGVSEHTFRRLLEGAAQRALVAETDGQLVGFVHYLFHPSSWSLNDSCYLEDLFVASGARGGGVGRALIQGVYAQADRAGARTVYWLTQEFNSEARALYDTLAHRTSFIRYER